MLTATQLTATKPNELDELFGAAPAGQIPSGEGHGQALLGTGTFAARPFKAFVRAVAWRGKEFDDKTHTLLNRIGPLGSRAIKADVYIEDSWLDGRPCIVLDYSKTSRSARWIRDEIREVAPGLYLGVVYVRSRRLPMRFSLQFDRATSAPEVEVTRDSVAVGDVE
jgi:hypothetical protein